MCKLSFLGMLGLVGLSFAGLVVATPALAGSTFDTPASLAAVARRDAAAARAGFAVGLRFYDALASRKGFSASVLKAVRANNREELARLFASAMGTQPADVTIQEIDSDVLLKGQVIIGHGKGATVITYCVDTENLNRCGGHGFSVTVAGP